MRAYKITENILNKFRAAYDGKGFISSIDTNGNMVVPIIYMDNDKFNLGADLVTCEIIECEIIQ